MVLYLVKDGKRITVLPIAEEQNEKHFCSTCGILCGYSKSRRPCIEPCADISCLKCILREIKDKNFKKQVKDAIEKNINLGELVEIDISIMDKNGDEESSDENDMPEFERPGDAEQFPSIMETPPPSPEGYREEIDEGDNERDDFAGLGWYFCLYCSSNGFKNKCCLGKHFREKHLDIRPYPCQICEWTFDTHGNLGQHMLSHMKDPCIKCHQCQDEYDRKKRVEKTDGIIAQKRKSNVGDYGKEDKMSKMRYSCVICNSQFVEKLNLDMHLDIAHGIRVKLTENQTSIVEEYCPDCQSLVGSEHCKKVEYTECGHMSCIDCVIKADDLGCGQCTTEKAQAILMIK